MDGSLLGLSAERWQGRRAVTPLCGRAPLTGDKGSSSVSGPSYNHEEVPGQTYWGALVAGWGTPQPGECFSFSAQWYDADDNPVGDPMTWEACCE